MSLCFCHSLDPVTRIAAMDSAPLGFRVFSRRPSNHASCSDAMKTNLISFIPSRHDGSLLVSYCSPAVKGRAKFIPTLRVELLLSKRTLKVS